MSTDSLVLTSEKTVRDYAMLFNAQHYPNITPRDDADILILAHRLYEGPESAVYDYLTRHKLAEALPELSESQNVANAISTSTQLLAIPLSEVAGVCHQSMFWAIYSKFLTTPQLAQARGN